MPQYHLSYDTIDCKKHFNDNYDEAKRYLLCVLSSIPNIKLYSFCESTITIHLDTNNSNKLFKYLKQNLSSYFYYYVSRIATRNDLTHIKDGNRNSSLNKKFQEELKKLDCKNLMKQITDLY